MSNQRWKRLRDGASVDIEEIQKEPYKHIDDIYYKEEPYGTKKVAGQLMIVTYSPRYAMYQKEIRNSQIARAENMVSKGSIQKQKRNPNNPARFVKVTAITSDGEVASKEHYAIDQDKIDSEAMYDGFYAICTDLVNDKIEDILAVSEGRWKIEESFRIMKTDFEARPVYVRKKDSIRAHFLICYLALLILRILEKKLDSEHTTSELISTLREYKLLKVNGQGYIPEYKRTKITDHLHKEFGFHTDTEIVPTGVMRKIIADTKK
ncbi:MAG: transposase [Erysipelotrichaceae bacterium]|nr:transposase [Erysipelotrichaceae bacterium]